MKKKKVRKLMQDKRRARQAQEPIILPAEFKNRLVRPLLSDPGRFAGSPREFAWRELKRSVEERKRREGRV